MKVNRACQCIGEAVPRAKGKGKGCSLIRGEDGVRGGLKFIGRNVVGNE